MSVAIEYLREAQSVIGVRIGEHKSQIAALGRDWAAVADAIKSIEGNVVPEAPSVEKTAPVENVEDDKPSHDRDAKTQLFLDKVRREGGENSWVKLSYTNLEGLLNANPTMVKTIIEDAVNAGKVRKVHVRTGESRGNNFTLNQEIDAPGAIVDSTSPIDESAKDKPNPKMESVVDADASDDWPLLEYLFDIYNRVNVPQFQLKKTSLCKALKLDSQTLRSEIERLNGSSDGHGVSAKVHGGDSYIFKVVDL